ncbi:hypothetical protein ACFQRB_16100 [Halobaculum litoreum]|uniref:DUF8053 domain-containing protein n=1 Tax=Halobaculum litoreum TaxID=3031998 RepID=A0ABD5XVQ4_9EURY
MPHRQLRKIGTDSVGIVLERSDFLERDGILDDEGDLPENTTAFTERLGERTYLVRVPEDGYVPDARVRADPAGRRADPLGERCYFRSSLTSRLIASGSACNPVGNMFR